MPLFRYLSVEPVAFLAILALYIEFPSIQDLIYTKICLEVVASHPNITKTTLPHDQAPSLSRLYNGSVIDFSIQDTSIFHLNGSQNLPSDGRIKERGNVTDMPALKSSHALCDRMNKSAIPLEIKQEIANQDSLFWLKYQILICLLCTISCPYWGGISDKLGRLIPLNLSILTDASCNLISLIFGLLISFNSHSLFHLNWLYLCAILVGLSGGQAVLIVNLFGFVCDNTSSDSRSKRVMLLESVIYLAHSVGFLLSKYIMSITRVSSDSIWYNRHFVAFGTCTILNLLASLCSMASMRHHKFHRFLNNFEREQRETAIVTGSSTSIANEAAQHNNNTAGVTNCERPRELTSSTPDDLDGPLAKPYTGARVNLRALITLKYFRETYETATKPREARQIILLLLLTGFLSALSLATLMSLLFVYLKMDPFNWTTSKYSEWNMFSAISRGAALICLTICMKFVKNWNVPDALVASLGFLSKGVGLIMIALADSSTIIYWSLVAFIPSEFSMPPIRSLLSKLVVKEELGKVYSCLALIQSICFLLGNVAFYLAYTTLDRQNSFQISFIVVGGLQFAAVIIMLIIDTTLRRRVMIV